MSIGHWFQILEDKHFRQLVGQQKALSNEHISQHEMYLFISGQLFARCYNSWAIERNEMSQSGLFIAFSNDAKYSTVM